MTFYIKYLISFVMVPVGIWIVRKDLKKHDQIMKDLKKELREEESRNNLLMPYRRIIGVAGGIIIIVGCKFFYQGTTDVLRLIDWID